jgi:hypothetical protein
MGHRLGGSVNTVRYDAYFDRSTSGIEGAFTLQKVEGGKAIKLFERLSARSGQRGWTNKEWMRSKSAIPFGTFRLWTDSIKQEKKSTFDGIGEFFPISSGENKNVIQGFTPDMQRVAIGLHRENQYPGSAGCIVLVDNTPALDEAVTRLFKFLRELEEPYITLKVL